jgi:hypothetical protein
MGLHSIGENPWHIGATKGEGKVKFKWNGLKKVKCPNS